MLRLLASLLFIAHIGAVTGPAVEASTDGRSGHECARMLRQSDSDVVTSPSDCPCCGFDGCLGKANCSVGSAAVVPDGAVAMAAASVSVLDTEFIGSQNGYLLPPTSPPPKA
ncbi:MAG: hypothetical protein ACYSUQ_10660 [Planctomycetota bacterium]|jgi:hypothetical protein